MRPSTENFGKRKGIFEKTVSAASSVLAAYVIGKTILSEVRPERQPGYWARNKAQARARIASQREASTTLGQAISTGRPKDKLEAIGAANRFGGKELGQKTIALFLERYKDYGYRVSDFDETATGVTRIWVRPDWLPVYDTVVSTFGDSYGLDLKTIPDDFKSYAVQNYHNVGTFRDLIRAWRTKSHRLRIDWSVPGTSYLFDAMKSIALDENCADVVSVEPSQSLSYSAASTNGRPYKAIGTERPLSY